MVKSPAHWTQPASDKASAAAEQKQLRPGKSQADLEAALKSSDYKAAAQASRRLAHWEARVVLMSRWEGC